MNNNINNISFKATLCPDVMIKSSKRLDNICKIFAKETAQFPDNTFNLFLTEGFQDESKKPVILLFTDKNLKSGNVNINNENIFVGKTLDKYMGTMNDMQIAKKFAKIFKVIHYKNLLTHKLPDIKAEYERIVMIADKLRPQASSKTEIQLLNKLESTINVLRSRYDSISKTSLENIKIAVRGDAELKKFASSVL